MQLQKAQVLAEKVRVALEPLCEKVVVAGSIRRQKAEVNDIDIVALPKAIDQPSPLGFGAAVHLDASAVWMLPFPMALKKAGLKIEISGPELIRCSFVDGGFQVDVYRARPETWGVILLIRTGSKDHNVKLCSLARSKGLKLSAAEGVVTQEGFGEGFGQIIASRTEKEIFSALGLSFVEPKNREVR
jgi:DNA polymerase (family X)